MADGGEHTDRKASGVVRRGALTALLQELAAAPAAGGGGRDGGGDWDPGLHVGAVVSGRYELVRELGRGGFGVVWKARDRELGRSVALKVVRPGALRDLRQARLLREAEAAARLSHPNIVTLFDVGESEHGPHLVLELLAGRTLAVPLASGAVPIAETIRIAVEVAKGLAHAHANGVVHRDLKPENVFLCDDGQVKVLDFGLAHAFGQRRVDGGTPAYMAPEQVQGAPEDERTDVWAFGVMLLEMISGSRPFGHESAARGAAPVIEAPGFETLASLLGRMLSAQPVDRPRDGGEVLAGLLLIARDLVNTAGAPVAPRVRIRRRTRLARPGLLVTGAAAGLLVLGVAAWRGTKQWRNARAEAGPSTSKPAINTAPGPTEFTILFAPFRATDPTVEGEARAMEAMTARAIDRMVRRAPNVHVVAGDRSPRTDHEAMQLGLAAGARVVLWADVNLLRGELVLEPVLTSSRPWDVDTDGLGLRPIRWHPADTGAADSRRAYAERIARPAALAAAQNVRSLDLLEDIGESSELGALTRGSILTALGKYQDAERALQEATLRWPSSFELLLALYAAQARRNAADPALLAAAAKRAATAAQIHRLATAYLGQPNFKGFARAEDLLRAGLRRHPGDKRLSFEFGKLLIYRARSGEGRALIAQAAREPMSPGEALAAFDALTFSGNVDAAQAVARRLVSDEAINPSLRVGFASALLKRADEKDRALAIASARRAVTEGAEMPDVLRVAGEVLVRTGNEAEGLDLLRRAVEMAPNGIREATALGTALIDKNPEAAREQLRRATTLEGSVEDVRQVVVALLELREPRAALQALDGVKVPAGLVVEARKFRCDALALLERKAEALKTAEMLRAATGDEHDRGQLYAMVCGARVGEVGSARGALRTGLGKITDPWSARIAAFLLGKITETELLTAPSDVNGMQADRRRCEAYYYAGVAHLYLANGPAERERAAAQFRNSLGAQTGCWAQDLAKIELYRLEHPPARP